MRLAPMNRPHPADAGPKMTLLEAAERCKVDVHWLRRFVSKAGIRPCARYANPSRHYYSLNQIRQALRTECKDEPHQEP